MKYAELSDEELKRLALNLLLEIGASERDKILDSVQKTGRA